MAPLADRFGRTLRPGGDRARRLPAPRDERQNLRSAHAHGHRDRVLPESGDATACGGPGPGPAALGHLHQPVPRRGRAVGDGRVSRGPCDGARMRGDHDRQRLCTVPGASMGTSAQPGAAGPADADARHTSNPRRRGRPLRRRMAAARRGLARVAGRGPARRLDRERHRRGVPRGGPDRCLARADSWRLRGSGGGGRTRVRDRRAAPRPAQHRRGRAHPRARRGDGRRPLDPRVGDQLRRPAARLRDRAARDADRRRGPSSTPSARWAT